MWIGLGLENLEALFAVSFWTKFWCTILLSFELLIPRHMTANNWEIVMTKMNISTQEEVSNKEVHVRISFLFKNFKRQSILFILIINIPTPLIPIFYFSQNKIVVNETAS